MKVFIICIRLKNQYLNVIDNKLYKTLYKWMKYIVNLLNFIKVSPITISESKSVYNENFFFFFLFTLKYTYIFRQSILINLY